MELADLLETAGARMLVALCGRKTCAGDREGRLSTLALMIPPKLPRYIVCATGETGEPALWQHNAHVGKVSLRLRTKALAQAAADQLHAEQRKK